VTRLGNAVQGRSILGREKEKPAVWARNKMTGKEEGQAVATEKKRPAVLSGRLAFFPFYFHRGYVGP